MIFVGDTVTLSWVLPPKPSGAIPVIGDFEVRIEGPYLTATSTVAPTTYTAPTTTAEGKVTYDYTPTTPGTYRAKLTFDLVESVDEQPFHLWNEEVFQVIAMPQFGASHPRNPSAFSSAPIGSGIFDGVLVEIPVPDSAPLTVILRDISGFNNGGGTGHQNQSAHVFDAAAIIGNTCVVDLPFTPCTDTYIEVSGGTPPYSYEWTAAKQNAGYPDLLMAESSDTEFGCFVPDIQAYRAVQGATTFTTASPTPCMDSQGGGGYVYTINVTVTDSASNQASDNATWGFEAF